MPAARTPHQLQGRRAHQAGAAYHHGSVHRPAQARQQAPGHGGSQQHQQPQQQASGQPLAHSAVCGQVCKIGHTAQRGGQGRQAAVIRRNLVHLPQGQSQPYRRRQQGRQGQLAARLPAAARGVVCSSGSIRCCRSPAKVPAVSSATVSSAAMDGMR